MKKTEHTIPADQLPFVDAFMKFGIGIGLPRGSARLLAYLMVCEPREQSAQQLRAMVGLSAGGASMATTMLVEMGLAEIVRKPGERRHYYRLVPDGFSALTRRRVETFGLGASIAASGLQLDPKNDRLLAVRDLYLFLEREMEAVMQRFDTKA
jgi:DNA-binding MarR family transcriptional regulator